MAHEARSAALREFFTPLVGALGYKFTPRWGDVFIGPEFVISTEWKGELP